MKQQSHQRVPLEVKRPRLGYFSAFNRRLKSSPTEELQMSSNDTSRSILIMSNDRERKADALFYLVADGGETTIVSVDYRTKLLCFDDTPQSEPMAFPRGIFKYFCGHTNLQILVFLTAQLNEIHGSVDFKNGDLDKLLGWIARIR